MATPEDFGLKPVGAGKATPVDFGLKPIQQQVQVEGQLPEGLAVPSGFQRGVQDIGAGVQQLYYEATDPEKAKRFTQQEQAKIEQYERVRGKDAGMDWQRLAGQGVVTLPSLVLPGAGLGTVARVGLGALEGGTTGGVQFVPEGDSRASNVVAGAALGAGAVPVTQVVSDIASAAWQGLKIFYGKASNKVMQALSPQEFAIQVGDAFQRAGINLEELPAAMRELVKKNAAEMLATTGKLDPEMIRRRTQLEMYNFKDETAPTLGQVSRDPVAFREEQYLSQQPGGEDIIYRELAQTKQMTDLGEQKVAEYGGETGGDMVAAERKLFDTLRDRWEKTGGEVRDLYKAASMTEGADAQYPMQAIATGFEDILPDWRRVIKKADPTLHAEMEDIINGQPYTVKELVDFRRSLTPLVLSTDPAERAAARHLTQIIDDVDVQTDNPAIQAYQVARKAARERFEEFGISKRPRSALEPLAEDKVYADNWIKNNVINGKTADIRKIKKAAIAEDPEVWNDVQAAVMRDIWEDATKAGEDKFSPAVFRKRVRDLNRSGRVAEIFTPKDTKFLNDLAEIAEWLMTSPKGAVKGAQTAPLLLSVLNRIDQFPMLGTTAAVVLKPAIAKVKDEASTKRISNLLADKKLYSNYMQIVEKGKKLDNIDMTKLQKTGERLSGYLQNVPSYMALPTYQEANK